MQDDSFGPAVDAVPPAHPLHLIGSFQCLVHAFPAHHLSFNDLQPVFASGVDLCQMGKEFFREQQGTVKGWPMVFQIGASHPTIFTDVVFLRISQCEIGNQIIPALGVS